MKTKLALLFGIFTQFYCASESNKKAEVRHEFPDFPAENYEDCKRKGFLENNRCYEKFDESRISKFEKNILSLRDNPIVEDNEKKSLDELIDTLKDPQFNTSKLRSTFKQRCEILPSLAKRYNDQDNEGKEKLREFSLTVVKLTLFLCTTSVTNGYDPN